MADAGSRQSLLAGYTSLFSLSGYSFVVVGFIARLPLAMAQMGTLLMVTAATDSYTAGGACAGALAIANGIGSPIAGALTDRVGQRVVVLVQAIVSAAGLAVLVVLTRTDAPWPTFAVAAAGAGFFLPQIGTLARIRWRELARVDGEIDRTHLNTAFSWEGAGDEASFVLGPASVGVLTALIDAQFAVLAAAVLALVFGVWFALHRTSALVPGAKAHGAQFASAISATAALMIGCQFLVGTLFGSVQTGTTVLATAAGAPGMAGLLHGLLGVGSVLAGIAIAALPASVRFHTRMRVFSAALFVLALPLLLVDSLGALAVVLAIMGFAIAPFMITNFSVIEQITPPTRLGVVMTMLAATTGLGYAAGSSTAGRLADWGGHTPAFAVTVSGALLAVLVANIAAHRLAKA